MKYTEHQRQKQRERAKAATDARLRVENTTVEWDLLIARLKRMLDAIEEKEPR